MDELADIFRARGLSRLEARICAAIALTAGKSNQTEIIELVWPYPDLEPDSAISMIGKYIFRIRQKSHKTGVEIPYIGAGAKVHGHSIVIKRKPLTRGDILAQMVKFTIDAYPS